jgi:hypothetical protein
MSGLGIFTVGSRLYIIAVDAIVGDGLAFKGQNWNRATSVRRAGYRKGKAWIGRRARNGKVDCLEYQSAGLHEQIVCAPQNLLHINIRSNRLLMVDRCA